MSKYGANCNEISCKYNDTMFTQIILKHSFLCSANKKTCFYLKLSKIEILFVTSGQIYITSIGRNQYHSTSHTNFVSKTQIHLL
jgi:hypothetical protein